MNQEKDRVYVQHILQCITQINEYTKNGKNDFYTNLMVQDAIFRRLQIMSESTQRLSDDIKATLPNINWKGLSGFRNILVHNYLDGIDYDTVWNLIENYLPDFEAGMKQIAANLEIF